MIMQISDNSIGQKATEVYVKFIKDPLNLLYNKITTKKIRRKRK
jgi:hypothetical protein